MSAEFNWFPGHMNKALKDIEAKIPVVDLVIEVVDARAPFSSQNLTFRKLLEKKPVLYVISKADVADKKITKQWINFFKKEGRLSHVLDYKNKHVVENLVALINEATAEKQAKDKTKGLVTSLINVLVIGIPNVGKSTFINKIIRDKSVKVGNKPGVTRGIQTLQLSKNITLMDTAGVLPSRLFNEVIASHLCAINSIKEGVFPLERIAGILMKEIFDTHFEMILDYYKIKSNLKAPISFEKVYLIFEHIAKSKKWLLRNDLWDIERAMSSFLADIANGKFAISLETPEDIEFLINGPSKSEHVKVEK
ncbi:ribosome biogenesis GTPase YlqF [Williamsoniiplasma luminosum]|uniref:Ribosome biogenesis GTPase A n=1 Tax=Williamsoniiplasma luminosum TaxID=214888 RepID=A0A2S0NJP1_9MOLU|nr:ribosome biogenesis GTPase YlqF [Williamsoniiplasma luminosum]AVP49234.1 MAG: ribosome biogenesis GTPase YlqF [Williamsoniiplasma luminosum]